MLTIFSLVNCDAPRFCCNHDQTGRGCTGRCIPESWLNDGQESCDNGSDEKREGQFEQIIFFKRIKSTV